MLNSSLYTFNTILNYNEFDFNEVAKCNQANSIPTKSYSILVHLNNEFMSNNKSLSGIYLFDSGASISVVNKLDELETYQPLPLQLEVAGGGTIWSRGQGTFNFNGSSVSCVYLPESPHNIISIPQLHQLGYAVFSTGSHIILLKFSNMSDFMLKFKNCI